MSDYVILSGGGAAGCLLAERLSRNANHSVHITRSCPSRLPPAHPHTSGHYRTHAKQNIKLRHTNREPQPELNHVRLFWQRKTLGGSTSNQCHVLHRGQARRRCIHWKVLGNTGWGYKRYCHISKP